MDSEHTEAWRTTYEKTHTNSQRQVTSLEYFRKTKDAIECYQNYINQTYSIVIYGLPASKQNTRIYFSHGTVTRYPLIILVHSFIPTSAFSSPKDWLRVFLHKQMSIIWDQHNDAVINSIQYMHISKQTWHPVNAYNFSA